jgi:3-hydroxyacyl-[acyl-carrier-protein] dehydratase
MRLLNDLYTIKSQSTSGSKAEFCVALNAENFIYQAHFPNNPITPGVCLIQMVKELVGAWQKDEYKINTLKNVKFTAPISPLEFPEIKFSLDLSQMADKSEVKAVVSENEVIFAKLNMILT